MAATFSKRGWSDRETTVKRDELLKILKENRTKHLAEYKANCEAYREVALAKIEEQFAELRKKVTEVKDKKFIGAIYCSFQLPAPESHERYYDMAFRMMELEVNENVNLTADQFGCFIMDDWEWSEGFKGQSQYFGGIKAQWSES